ncbi:MAG: hypothetical protein Q4B78_05155 [Bacillota bacterium]|nr:hypothetical protein [Bacillota bacterium]
MDYRCTICGREYKTRTFKGGYVCDDCLQFVRDNYGPEYQVHN